MPLDAQTRQFLDTLAAQNAPSWDEMAPAQGREVFASLKELFGRGPDVDRVETRTIGQGVRIRIYWPSAADDLPVAMFFHGGGWVLGNLETHDALCRRLTVESACVVVSVEYRCAPEHIYPVALDDCFDATAYVAGRQSELGIDADRLAVVGDSAGGNLAAAVALRARDAGGPAISSQVLIYPVVEPRFDTGSYVDFAEGYGLTRAVMIWFWKQYVGDDVDAAGPYAAVSRTESLEGLPAAHIITAEYDVLRDEGERFADELAAAGVATTQRRYDGVIHGFVHLWNVFDTGRQAVSDVAGVIRTSLS